MKLHHHITSDDAEPFLQEKGRWPLVLFTLHQRLAPFFARPEPHQHALLYLQAVISDIPRKNGWQIAEHAKQARPYGMQRLLSRATWDEEGVRNELRTLVGNCLKEQPQMPEKAHQAVYPAYIIDESGFPKRGTKSAGVQTQYCGATGRVEPCQVGVFLSYATAAGHALIDRELYLSEEWIADTDRRQAAHIPDTITFETKPELARRMIQRALAAQLPVRWVVGDTVYGHSTDLRVFLEKQGLPFALAIPANEVVCVATAQGYRMDEVAHIERLWPDPLEWHRLSMSEGTKGQRLFDWAIMPHVHRGIVDGCHFLVIRRCIDDPRKKTYYLVAAPPGTSLHTMVLVIGTRWWIEVDLENAKDLGLDHYEVRSYLGWYRHITLVMLAAAFLLSICLQDAQHHPLPQHSPPSPSLIPLTLSEAQHLLARLFWPAPSYAPLICWWSTFRREHQYWAGYYHRRRRVKAG